MSQRVYIQELPEFWVFHAGEISVTIKPHYHPIAPVLMDFAAAREAWPQCELPVPDR